MPCPVHDDVDAMSSAELPTGHQGRPAKKQCLGLRPNPPEEIGGWFDRADQIQSLAGKDNSGVEVGGPAGLAVDEAARRRWFGEDLP